MNWCDRLKALAGRFGILLFLGLVHAASANAQSVITHHQHAVVRSGALTQVGRLPAEQVLHLDLGLALRDQDGLNRFLADVYNPRSPSYRHFLKPAEFTARFGPTQQSYDEVVRFASRHGLTVVGGSLDRRIVQIAAPVKAVEEALNVRLLTYRHPTENRVFYAPDREPTTDLSFALWHVSGLDNYSIPHPRLRTRTAAEKATAHATTGSGPSASFLGSDMRAAYATAGGTQNTSLTGAGQTIGLWEYEGTDLADLTTYYTNIGATQPLTPILVSTDGTSTSCLYSNRKCDDTEQTLDMTQALGMAPGISQLVVFVGSTDTSIISAMVAASKVSGQPAYNLPLTIGCSWGWTPADPTTLDPYFQQMAAQGQTFFAASGDSSTWSSSNEAWPADDANVLSVGGTDLNTAGAGGTWSSETAWVDSGGGVSPDKIAIPAWQQLAGVINSGNKGSTTYRNGPDVSANANFSFYVCADQTTCTANSYGGTSFAAPMWAAYIALVNQQLSTQKGSTTGIGFLNSLLYNENVNSTTYATDFHDITSGTSGSYSATTGYDLVTGWGSPTPSLIATLVTAASTPSFTLSASPAAPSVATTGGSAGVTITSAVAGGFAGSISLATSTLPTGVTASFASGTLNGAGSTTLTLTVAAGTATGTYPITVTGTSASLTASTTVTLTVSAPSGFSLSTAGSLSVTDGSSASTTVTSTVTGGFSGAISLSASGQPSGVTATFSPTSITGAGSSTVKFTASSTAAAGSYPVTIKGTSGSTSQTASLTLTVAAAPGFSVATSPGTLTITRPSSGSTTGTVSVTEVPVNGFTGAVSLSASGLPSRVTASFSPTSISGSAASTLTFTVPSNARAGSYTVTVTGKNGSTSHTATVALTLK